MYKWDKISIRIPKKFLKVETVENNSKGLPVTETLKNKQTNKQKNTM